MLISAMAQIRYAASVALGLPFAPWSLDRLLDAVRDTRQEFGTVGSDAAALVHGPELDEETQREMQLRRFRKQATLAARDTPAYEMLFERLGLDPSRLGYHDLRRIPPTRKQAVRTSPDAFVRRGSAVCLGTTTTGTTGSPTSISFSASEIRTYAALSAISFLAAGDIDASDVVQICTSSRATLGNTCFAGACARIGALVSPTGLVEPARALALLRARRDIPGQKARVSVLSTYPSYLGELVEEGLRSGYRQSDFALERVIIGGELLSEGLRARTERLFGPVRFVESYGMTETWPMCGQRCEQGHLHFEPSQGLVELVDPIGGTPAHYGQIGTILATPFRPYRDTTILLRYDTEDLARPIAGPLDCSLRALPATTNLLGKLQHAVQHDQGWTVPRDLLEVLEGLDEVPLPARYGVRAVSGGIALEVVTRSPERTLRSRIQNQLEERGVPVQEITLLDRVDELRYSLPLRCDLREGVPARSLPILRAFANCLPLTVGG